MLDSSNIENVTRYPYYGILSSDLLYKNITLLITILGCMLNLVVLNLNLFLSNSISYINI